MSADQKKKRYHYEAICIQQGCKVKGVMQEYKSDVPKDTITCVSCGNDIPLSLVKIDLLMYQEGVEVNGANS